MFKKIYIEITNICNLKCEFCPETKRNKKSMNVEDLEKIIEKTHNYTNLICLHVKGEPLLHNQLEEILNIIDKYNLKANITTNGTLLKQNLEILKKSKAVKQINISIHSITQNKKLDKKYLQEIFDSVEQLQNINISYRLWNLQDFEENDINDLIIEKIENYYNILELKQKLKENSFLKIRENLYINQDKEFKWPNINNKNIIEKGRCLALKEQIAILVDGTVVPCCLDNNGDIALGNILKENFEEILQKQKSLEIKRNFEDSIITCELCKTCGFLKNLEEKRKQSIYKIEQK